MYKILFFSTLVLFSSLSFSSCKPKKANCPAYRGIDANAGQSGGESKEFRVSKRKPHSLFPREMGRKKKRK